MCFYNIDPDTLCRPYGFDCGLRPSLRMTQKVVFVLLYYNKTYTARDPTLPMARAFSAVSSWAQSKSEHSEDRTVQSAVRDLGGKSSTPLRFHSGWHRRLFRLIVIMRNNIWIKFTLAFSWYVLTDYWLIATRDSKQSKSPPVQR